ncbi:oligopeptidase A [Glaciecola petra]|uniref:oligopeptidase A n=1 Tax=Glaciecola petra TaxID=3075602 RepID=A0ABU2ZUY5_9ALTE|nr:oligopeptidase A [Aestuariibacter sp. P117]MDT0595399.1 oligopeptidase A [Aestuariibacter sp. P117]
MNIKQISPTQALSDLSNNPVFSAIDTSEIVSQVEQAIGACKQAIEDAVANAELSYENVVLRLEEADDQLGKLFSPISHMNSVVSSDDLREAHDACLPLLSEYSTFVGQHEGLYKLYQTLQDSEAFTVLSEAQQKVITNGVRDFTLSGVALDEDKKETYAKLKSRLSDLSSQFSNNLMDATLAFTKHVSDKESLSGLPESALEAAAQAAHQKDLQGYLFTLDIPSYLPVMMYADNRHLREEMYRAYVTRASDEDITEGKFDNAGIIDETLALRTELAQLLGFENYADYSLATKMAENQGQVTAFLNDLAKRSKPQAQKEKDEIIAFAESEYGVPALEAWDYPYYGEKLKQRTYAVSDEELRPYFPEDKVLSGLFEVVSRLYGLQVVQVTDVDTWHKDARYFEIHDAAGELRGAFYLDLYARVKKRGGAWMDECRVRRTKADGTLQSPVAYLTCNFSGPVGDKPALFTHDEVITLFHEFGHGIHHMLTKIDVAGVSGINGVAWDAVELPSQFLENWCWQPEALAFISGHYETGESLPQDLLDKMLAARNFQSAMQMVRQLEFSLFDFTLHQQTTAEKSVQAVLDNVREKVSVTIPPSFNKFQNSFGHIFAGGYAAGYYSYKWAEVLSSDAFSKFEEEGIFNADVGQAFLTNVLEMGGSKEPMELFKAFRGREPSTDALLRHSGIN